jgi:TRAP-type C4-dicarboxylate transport system permease large subunit
VSKLFLAGVIPGILMCVCLAIAAYVISIRHNYPSEPFPGWGAWQERPPPMPCRASERQ